MATISGILAAASMMPVKVVTGSEARPTSPGTVWWVGGATKPVNMINGDIWLRIQDGAATAPTFITTSLNTITQSVAFSQALLLNGTPPMTFSVTSGALPAGLALDTNTGVVSGTPTASGTYTFTVQATNAVGSITQSFTGTVSSTAIAPTIGTTTLNSLTQGTAFSQTLSVLGTTPITWTVAAGTLPAGLTLNSSLGTITGSPTGTGAYSVTLQATNLAGNDTKAYTGTIASTGTAPVITTTTLTTLTVGVAFSQTLARTGSTPMTWGISAGTIPSGLSINSSSGVIAGTPTTAAAYSFTVQATNSFGNTTQVYTGSVVTASPTTYSIFGTGTPSVVPTSYTDGVSGAWNVQQFYQYSGHAALPAGTKIVGARQWVPAGSAHIGKSWKAGMFINATAQISDTNLIDTIATINGNGTSKLSPTPLAAGWNEILFNAQYDPPPSAGSWCIGVMIDTGTSYLYDNTLSTAPIQNPEGKNFYLAELGTSPVARSLYESHTSSAHWYGVDVLMIVPS